jgi:hypothetical protein
MGLLQNSVMLLSMGSIADDSRRMGNQSRGQK